MAFKLFQQAYEKNQAEYMSHVSTEFIEWLDSKDVISESDVDDYFDCRGMNSYERELMYPKLDDAALIRFAKNCLNHCTTYHSKKPCSTYDQSITNIFMPLLIQRLQTHAG